MDVLFLRVVVLFSLVLYVCRVRINIEGFAHSQPSHFGYFLSMRLFYVWKCVAMLQRPDFVQ